MDPSGGDIHRGLNTDPSKASIDGARRPTRGNVPPETTADVGNHLEVLSGEFQRSWPPLWAIAVSIVRDRHDAHDVVQEAAMIAIGKAHEFEPGTSFQAWAGQIVRYVALNHRRRSARDRVRPADPHDLQGTPARPTDGASGMDRKLSPILASALDTLDETPRICLLMRVVLGMSYPEISESLGIPEGTAMSHVFRARKILRSTLDADGAEGGRQE